jgi:hypothetical protein
LSVHFCSNPKVSNSIVGWYVIDSFIFQRVEKTIEHEIEDAYDALNSAQFEEFTALAKQKSHRRGRKYGHRQL